jgi:hypothetical protein
MSLVVTVLVSALVSALVALGIEYAAKPRIEARKELLLEGYRRRRELLGHLDTISMIAASWSELPAGERDRQWQRLAAMTETMFDNAWLYAASYRRVFRQFGRPSAFDLIGSYLYTARGGIPSLSAAGRGGGGAGRVDRAAERAVVSRVAGAGPAEGAVPDVGAASEVHRAGPGVCRLAAP